MRVTYKDDWKCLRSSDCNYDFNMKTGVHVVWGASLKDDIEYSPFGPFIADIEIVEACKGVRGVLCPYCFPPGEEVLMSDGTTKFIEKIQKGDRVKSYDFQKKKVVENRVLETYDNLYEGVLINIELDDGRVLQMTPEHPVFTKNRGWVEAKDLTEDDDVQVYKNTRTK
jgi:hypothetical protein